MKFKLADFNISEEVFSDKVRSDLNYGVRIRSGEGDNRDIVKVWTDTKDWQFDVTGLANIKQGFVVEKVQIQSYGESKLYLQMQIEVEHGLVHVERLSKSFAEFSEVSLDDADIFINSYMQSSFNRYLTEKSYEEIANDEDYHNWLIN